MSKLLDGVSNALSTVTRWLLRAAVIVAGLVFGLSLLVAGVVLALGVTVWSLLRGRRPQGVLFRRFSAGRWPPGVAGMGPGAPFSGRPAARQPVEIVDIEARDVTPGGQGAVPPPQIRKD